jgi:hypothetical protein
MFCWRPHATRDTHVDAADVCAGDADGAVEDAQRLDIGFRIGKDANLHISALNVTRGLAPVPVKKG